MLNEFQRKCEEMLKSELSLHGGMLSDRRVVKGKEEIYVVADIFSANLTVYICENEALFSDSETDYRFEAPDYDTSDALIHDFVQSVIERLKNG